MLRWLVLIVCVLGCGGSARTRPRSPEYVAKIRIEGNHAIESDELIPHLALERTRRGGRALDPYQLGLDTQRIRAAYVRRGFFGAAVTSRIDGKSGPQTVVFVVVEGIRAKARVQIRGLPPEITEARARELIGIEEGSPFDYQRYDDAKQALQELLEEAGYAHAQLDAAVIVTEPGVATARFLLQTGPLCRFGSLTISGVGGDLADAITGRLAFAEGELYSPSALARTQRALYELGRFATVRVEPERSGGAAVVPVAIVVSPGARRERKHGFGVGFDPLHYEIRGRLGGSIILADHPLWTLFGDARVAGLFDYDDFDYPDPKVRVLGTAQRLDVLRPRITGEIGAGFDYLAVEAYTSVGPQVSLSLFSPLGVPWLQLRTGWAFSYQWFDGISPVLDAAAQARYGLDRAQRLGSFQQTIALDGRGSNPLVTRDGGYASLRLAEGTALAGSAFEYVQITPDLRFYRPIGPMVFAIRMRFGVILGDVPVTERFYSGGQNHRGFSERGLSPRVMGIVDGEPATVEIGGAAMFETGVELRIPVAEPRDIPLGVTLFADAGDVTEDLDALDLGNLHWAVGFGLSAVFGGIKVRADAAYRVNRNGPSEPEPDALISNTALHLGVGDTF